MKCRNIINGKVQWFTKDSIVSDGDAVKASLEQKLSVIRGEIFYDIRFGLPLYEKTNSKVFVDSAIISAIQSTEGVVEITKFESIVVNRKYSCSVSIRTIYGDVELTV